MMMSRTLVAAFLAGLAGPAFSAGTSQDAVDAAHASVVSAVSGSRMTTVADIDHARLAAQAGVEMPPSRVVLFSDPAVNGPLLAENVRAGLDLPFRMLAFAEGAAARIMYTSSAFLAERHGLSESALAVFDSRLSDLRKGIAAPAPVTAPTAGLSRDFGIIELRTTLDVPTAVERVSAAVQAQDDTIWFGQIDFTAQAAVQGIDLPPAQLLLFGGPAPGGVAMADYPAIGLDAFCQKLLVYSDGAGGAVLIFNDIAAMARLHYGVASEAHDALNARLTETFATAIR